MPTPAYVTISDSFGGDYFPLCVEEDNCDPTANVDGFQDGVGGTQTLNVLANDTDPADESLYISNYTTPADGTLTVIDSGTEFTYTPNTGFFGTDTFTDVATDGSHQSNTATVTINVLLPKITLSNIGTNPVLLSDDATDPTANADSSHLDELQIAVDPDSVFASLPYNLTDWMLNLDAVSGDGMVEFWNSLGKSTELDSSGTGDETWDFGSTIASADIPAHIFTDVNALRNENVELNLVPPSGSLPRPPAPPMVTIAAKPLGTLTAETINDSLVSDDVGGSPDALGLLQHGQTAYVPVDNEDQYYVERGTDQLGANQLVPNMSQGVVTDDWALLPFTVSVPYPGASTLYLEFPDSIRIYTAPSVAPDNLVSSGETTINDLLDSNGNATFYIQGVSNALAQIALVDADYAEPLDTLNVDVFTFSGPQNVPNYSIYQYGVTGLTPASLNPAPWSTATLTTSDQIDSETFSSAVVHWGARLGSNGAHIGVLSFEIDSDYTWSYYVNVVEIDITNPTGAPAFTPGTPSLYGGPGFIQFVSGDPALEATAKIVLTGPHTLTASGGRGVDQITVGFVQTGIGFSANAFYSGTAKYPLQLASTAAVGPYPVLDTGNVNQQGAVHGVEHPWYNFPNHPGSADPVLLDGHSGVISMSDTPRFYFLENYNQVYQTDALVDRIKLTFQFTLDIAANVVDPDPQTKKVYTRLATVNWSYVASGSFTTPGLAASFDGYNSVYLAGASWALITNGSREAVANRPTFNDYLINQRWYDPNNSN